MGQPEGQTIALPEWAIQIERLLGSMEPLQTKGEAPAPERTQRRRMHGLPAALHTEQDFHLVYKPQRVSLGPLCADCDTVKAKEVKEASLIHFIRRSPGKQLVSYYKALRAVVDELRDAYDGLDQRWRSDTEAFLRMMLLDGCFLLEFIRTKIDHQQRYPSPPHPLVNTSIWSIVENHDEMKCYLHDFLLVENQLPMMLLQTLLTVEGGDCSSLDLRHMLLEVAVNTFGTRSTYVSRFEFKSSSHLLDVYWMSLVHKHFDFKWRKTLRRMTKREEIDKLNNIPQASELVKAGIVFTISDSTSLLDISFRRNTLKLPHIAVDGLTKSTFLNLIALENLHKNVYKKEITSYMYFMGCLVQSAEDASLLQSRGIIETALPAAEVATLFKRMIKDICPDRNDPLNPDFIKMLTIVRKHYNKIVSNEWRKDLTQTYLKTWKKISVGAASLLLTLTIIQTVFTVLSYVHPK